MTASRRFQASGDKWETCRVRAPELSLTHRDPQETWLNALLAAHHLITGSVPSIKTTGQNWRSSRRKRSLNKAPTLPPMQRSDTVLLIRNSIEKARGKSSWEGE